MDRLTRWIFRPSSLQVVSVIVLAVFTVVSVIIVNGNDGKTSLKDVEQKAGLMFLKIVDINLLNYIPINKLIILLRYS